MKGTELAKFISDWQASIGRKGGRSRSAAKRKAGRKNAAKARKAREEKRRKALEQ